MGYHPLTQVLFQLVGGFAVAHVFAPEAIFQQPLISPMGESPQQPLDNAVVRSATMIINTVHSLAVSPSPYRSLQQDIDALLVSYKWLCMLGVTLLLMSGGAPAVVGGGASLYFSGEEGTRRYIHAKQWYNRQK